MPRTTIYGPKNVQVSIQPNIGLEASIRQSVVELLGLVLADEAVLLHKTRRAGENSGEPAVPKLQTLYDAQYQQIKAIVTEITERVHILGGAPPGSAEELIPSARLEGEHNTVPGIVSLLADHEALIRFLREDAQKCSEMYEDQGTFAMLVGVMRIHEKMAWLLRSNIALEQFDHHEK